MKRHRHLTNMKSFTSCSSAFLKLCKLQQYFSIFKASLQQCDSNVCAKYNLGRSVQFLSFAWSYYLMGYFKAVWQKKTCYHFAFVLPTEQFLNCFLHRILTQSVLMSLFSFSPLHCIFCYVQLGRPAKVSVKSESLVPEKLPTPPSLSRLTAFAASVTLAVNQKVKVAFWSFFKIPNSLLSSLNVQ